MIKNKQVNIVNSEFGFFTGKYNRSSKQWVHEYWDLTNVFDFDHGQMTSLNFCPLVSEITWGSHHSVGKIYIWKPLRSYNPQKAANGTVPTFIAFGKSL